MKKLSYILFSVGLLFICGIKVYAAPSSSISVSRSQIENGQSVTATLTIKNVAAWQITNFSATGNTNGCSLDYEKYGVGYTESGSNTTKTFKITCSSNSTGIIKFNYSGAFASEDGSKVKQSGSKSVTVVAARPKSTNNYLKTLEIEGTTISPEFNKDTLEYTATLEAGTEKATIIGEKADSYASVTGVGEKDVVEGENKFEVVVTSESGQVRTYVVTITVKEFDPIIIKVDGKEYTVVRKLDAELKPDSFTETTVTIGENTIQAFYNEVTGITVVGLKDENGKVLLFKYDDENYTRYYEFKFNQLTINVIDMNKKFLPKGYKEYTVKLGEEEFKAYKFTKDSDYALVYGVDVVTGEKNLYQVDLKNNTVQLYNDELIDYMKETDKNNLVIFAILGGVIFLEFLVILLTSRNKKRLLNRLKNEKVEKSKNKAIDDAKKETVEEKEKKKKKSE